MPRWVVIPLVLGLGACRPEAKSDALDAAVPFDSGWSTVVAGGPTHCRTRQAVMDHLANKYRLSHPQAKEVPPGESAGLFCLADARSLYDERVRDTEHGSSGAKACSRVDGEDAELCKLREGDFTFERSRLVRIRLHGKGRDAPPNRRYLRPDWYLIPPYTYFGTPEAKVLENLPGPRSRTVVRDAEFGEVILLEYDGLTLELDKTDGGAILAGIVVQRKGS